MERDIADFHQRHPELCLLGTVGMPRITTVCNFIAPDGVRVGVSIDFGRWKHMSFSKRGGQASEEEIIRYLDFFGDTPWLKTLSPLGTGIVHFYEVGYPHAELLKEVYVGKDAGRWPKGTRVRKVNTKPGDTHQDGALGTIVGALGPTTASQRAELIIELAKQGIEGDVEYFYWVEWDDMPGIPVGLADYRIEPIANE